jgi:uncharacterized OB-fold protein
MGEPRAKPVPVPDETTRPFWEAAAEGRLIIQRCTACGHYNHPPRPFCDACLSQQLNFVPVSGCGTVWTFIVTHQCDVPGFENDAPFINIVVELAEQPLLLMVSDLPYSERVRVRIGAPVEVYFETRGGIAIPRFRLV